ncbi:MAG: hypothetical protein D6683_12450 [Actinomyces sp.]|nr:MAG: hypothetical protein D6683_12450 [Actinomyces sp.]
MTDAAATSEPTATDEVLHITDAALETVLEIRAREDDAESLGLRVAVTGVAGVDYAYDLSLEPVAEADDDAVVYQRGELSVIIPADSVERLRGATLDLPSNPAQGGLVIRNPNRPNPLGDLGQLELTGDTADKVRQLLEQRINPALASHGGYAELVGVDGDVVHITMGGGCQGCAMSQATLTAGIRAAILEAIPEVSEVVDATDHAAGASPYYT